MHVKRINKGCKRGVRRYTHDVACQRVKKTTSATTSLFMYDEGGQLLGEYDSAGGALYETVYLDEQPVAVLKPAVSTSGYKAYYLYADHLNTPRLITDNAAGSANKKVWQWDSDPFGITQPNENPAAAGVFTYNPRFPGQVYDKETGLHYNYFRDYNPVTGRYVQSDPIGLAGGMNTFGYVGGNPVSFTDLLGLASIGRRPIEDMLLGGGGGGGSISGGAVAIGGAIVGATLGSTIDAMCKPDDPDKCKNRTFHRLKSPTQTVKDLDTQVSSGMICGGGSRQIGGGISPLPSAKAYPGPLPVGQPGIEFKTSVCPTSDGPIAYWYLGTPGVLPLGDLACVPATITKVVP